jgi:hypothetical protein
MDAGWYQDPSDASQRRFWDGSRWSGHVQQASGLPPTVSAPLPPPPAPLPAVLPPPPRPVASVASADARYATVSGVGVPGADGLVVLPKNPAVMVIASVLLSGLGSILCGKTGTGLVLLCIEIGGALVTFVLLLIPIIGWFLALMLWPFLLGAWLFGLWHAYQAAQSWNRAIGVVA